MFRWHRDCRVLRLLKWRRRWPSCRLLAPAIPAPCWRGFANAQKTSLWAPVAASWTSSSPPTARRDHALLLDCRDLSFKLAPIPAHIALVIANTMVKHSVAGGDYTTRRAEVEAACAVIARHRPEVRFLRDATVDDLGKMGPRDDAQLAQTSSSRRDGKPAHTGCRRGSGR